MLNVNTTKITIVDETRERLSRWKSRNATVNLPSALDIFSPNWVRMWRSSDAGTTPLPDLSWALNASTMSCWHFSMCVCLSRILTNVAKFILPSAQPITAQSRDTTHTRDLKHFCMHISRLWNDLYCVEWDVNSTIPYHTIPTASLRTFDCMPRRPLCMLTLMLRGHLCMTTVEGCL